MALGKHSLLIGIGMLLLGISVFYMSISISTPERQASRDKYDIADKQYLINLQYRLKEANSYKSHSQY